jgi:hypothetical protein
MPAKTTLEDARRVYHAMLREQPDVVAASLRDPTSMIARRIDDRSAVAVYRGRVYLLYVTTGTLNYSDFGTKGDRARSTELVGFEPTARRETGEQAKLREE